MAIIDYRKSIIHMTLKMDIFDPLLKSIIYAKQDVNTISYLAVTKIPKL